MESKTLSGQKNFEFLQRKYKKVNNLPFHSGECPEFFTLCPQIYESLNI